MLKTPRAVPSILLIIFKLSIYSYSRHPGYYFCITENAQLSEASVASRLSAKLTSF